MAYLAGFGMVQIPKLDMSVPNCDKVGAVLGERHARHLTGHLVGSHHYVFLQRDTTMPVQIKAFSKNTTFLAYKI